MTTEMIAIVVLSIVLLVLLAMISAIKEGKKAKDGTIEKHVLLINQLNANLNSSKEETKAINEFYEGLVKSNEEKIEKLTSQNNLLNDKIAQSLAKEVEVENDKAPVKKPSRKKNTPTT